MSIRGTAGYNLGGQNSFGGPSMGMDKQNESSPLDAIREQTSKIEDFLDTLSDPVKPYALPHVPSKTPQRTTLRGLCVLEFNFDIQSVNFHILQIFTCDRTIPHRRHILGRCTENNHTMERSTSLPPRLQTQ